MLNWLLPRQRVREIVDAMDLLHEAFPELGWYLSGSRVVGRGPRANRSLAPAQGRLVVEMVPFVDDDGPILWQIIAQGSYLNPVFIHGDGRHSTENCEIGHAIQLLQEARLGTATEAG